MANIGNTTKERFAPPLRISDPGDGLLCTKYKNATGAAVALAHSACADMLLGSALRNARIDSQSARLPAWYVSLGTFTSNLKVAINERNRASTVVGCVVATSPRRRDGVSGLETVAVSPAAYSSVSTRWIAIRQQGSRTAILPTSFLAAR